MVRKFQLACSARGAALIALAVVGLPALAQSSSEETAQGEVAVTIYNNDQALVQDVRQLHTPRGRQPSAPRFSPLRAVL